ncbi:MAG TPA: ankyrin repeat domain-containing protein [Vicinamibacterales bacterium]|nr:ankyrin repeat domain-containing protein [Vicinamibacterales bacterium]
MPARRLPVRPNLDQLKHQAKDLLKAYRRGDADARADVAAFHPDRVAPESAKLADAQLVLARSYEAPSWMRLVQCCELIDAIWNDDPETVRRLVTANRNLLTENAGIRNSNWGPPLSYAANLGRDRIIRLLYDLGARDLQQAIGRAILQSRIETAAMLHEMLGRPEPPPDAFGGPAYTLSVPGTEFLFRIGLQMRQGAGMPVETVIGSDSRRPADKRRILEIYAEHGYVYPDTPMMAFHRGRFDLLERHLAADPDLIVRRFAIDEIFPPEVGCRPQPYQAMGTPVDGGTLLHLAVYWDELDMAEWLLDHGADPNARAAVDADGFGGHTPLFNAVVSQEAFWINYSRGGRPQPGDTKFVELLLARGADPNVRASIRMRLSAGHGDTRIREFRGVTPLGWGRAFAREQLPSSKHREILFVNAEALSVIEAHGAKE